MRKFLIGLLFLSLSGCLFEPDGKFYKKITEKDFSSLSVNLNVADDTLYISKRTQLSYSMQAPDFTIVEVRATLNQESIYTSTALENIIYFDPHVFGSGTYLLTLSLVVQSGTGSLADRFGAETVQVWRSFVVIIDVAPPEPITITRLDTTEGTLTIHWDRYTRWNFESYVVVKSCSYDNYYFTDCVIEEIFSNEVTSWTDENFVGGYVSYRVDVKAAEQNARGITKNYQWIPKTSFTIDENSEATLHWDKPLFYKNTKSIRLENPPGILTEFQDTLYHRPELLRLGLYYGDFNVVFTSGNEQNYKFTVPHYLGERFEYPSVRPTLYNKKENLYYGYDHLNSGLIVMDDNLSSLHRQHRSDYHVMAISPNGEFLITHQSDNTSRSIGTANPFTLETSNVMDLPQFTWYSELSVSDNGLIACRGYNENVVYKLPDYEIIFSQPSQNDPIIISGNGDYLFNNSTLYEFDGITFQEIGEVEDAELRTAAFTRDDNLILGYSDGLVNILNKNDLSIVRSIQVPMTYLFNLKYDDVSNQILVFNHQDIIYRINIEDGTTVQANIFSNAFSFLNGKVFTRLVELGENVVSLDYNLLE